MIILNAGCVRREGKERVVAAPMVFPGMGFNEYQLGVVVNLKSFHRGRNTADFIPSFLSNVW